MIKEYHFKTIDSTSSYLKSNYHKHDDLTFISSDFQNEGHGRYNRKWISKEGENLLFSILIKDKELISRYDSISLASAACIYEVLNELGIENVSVKWPNDVFVNDKKISGILLESISNGGDILTLILGVGINVNSTNFEENLKNIPTSICMEINQKIKLEDFKNTVYDKFIKMLKNIKNNDYSYLDIINANNYLKGKKAYAYIKEKKELVEVMNINKDNSLKVKKGNDYINLYSGEISFHI